MLDGWFALHHDDLCERFQSFFAGNLCAGGPFGFIGKINVFECRLIPAFCDALFQFVGQFALFLDGTEDEFLTFLKIGEALQFVVDSSDLHLVESAGRLLAITADERYGSTVVQQFHCMFDLRQSDGQFV